MHGRSKPSIHERGLAKVSERPSSGQKTELPLSSAQNTKFGPKSPNSSKEGLCSTHEVQKPSKVEDQAKGSNYLKKSSLGQKLELPRDTKFWPKV